MRPDLSTEQLRDLVDRERADPFVPRSPIVLRLKLDPPETAVPAFASRRVRPEPTEAQRKRADAFVAWLRGIR